ncbi:MAG: hypothetical protein LBI14_02695 [Treponema sp.]|jgi:hypothetical protein|nr:hypothetical protein [Treponema sp.]
MAWDYERCVSIFNEEMALLKKIFGIEESVHEAVMAREWTDFEWKIAEITQAGEEFNKLEAQRVEILANLREKNNVGDREYQTESEFSFYALAAAKLTPQECREISGLYRELKMETLKVKVLNEAFTGYVNELRTMTAAWLEAIFPVKGGKLYTRKGRQAARDLRSVVLNQHI